jgi:murein DD-endopeptidase MepM/ murein hydrolase activator NlpD
MAFTSPIGTPEERATGRVWPGKWVERTSYDELYELGYHTGADLNLNFPHYDSNAHSPVYAIGDGAVTFAKLFSTTEWGNLIVIDHGIVDGKPLFSRYGHVEALEVSKGDTVKTGDRIAAVGNGEELFPYHLHFDISRTDVLRDRPGDWPGHTRARVLKHYVNPQGFLQLHVDDGVNNLNVLIAQTYYVTATLGLRVRQAPSTSALQVGTLPFGSKVSIEDTETVNQDSFTWGRISGGAFHSDWMAMGREDQSESFVSKFSPGG